MKILRKVTRLVVIWLLVFEVSRCTARRFGYSASEQRLWKKKNAHCSGPNQSPIAIHSRRSIPMNIPAIEFVYFHNLLPGQLQIHNNGHSISLITPKPENFSQFPLIFGGKLRAEFEFEGLHFHWGDKNNRGSEHVMNDVRYPLECHMIHRNKKYHSLQEALKHKDGLAVLGEKCHLNAQHGNPLMAIYQLFAAFFYAIKETDGIEIDNIVRHLDALDETNDVVPLSYTFSLSSLIGNINTERFYTYRGSLTTPTCNPAVTWVLFPDTIPISLNQMAKFRSLSNGVEGLLLVDNFRHLQPIGNRKVFLRSVSSRFTSLEKLSNHQPDEGESFNEEDPPEWYYH